ncbi:type I-E CRISPR-associated protein Cas6/Cse3/CasE [Kitasatospora sp. NPDC085464]|uniref:type I-E CRISPR-associated protein Cas6/Cse3/CasE n=1 Tax=Kitasatospora sp. NPDC085464 TaxID=3364063 RepID=UPI0037C6C3C8
MRVAGFLAERSRAGAGDWEGFLDAQSKRVFELWKAACGEQDRPWKSQEGALKGGRPETGRSSAGLRGRNFTACHSILVLDLEHSHGAQLLLDARNLSRTVMSGFTGWSHGHRGLRSSLQVLSDWTVDLDANLLRLVVQSRVAPDWTNIPRRALAEGPAVRTVSHRFVEGDVFAFRTVIQPVSHVSQPSGRGRRVSRKGPEAAREWFTKRLQGPDEPRHDLRGIVRIGAQPGSDGLSVRSVPAATSTQGSCKGLHIDRAEVSGTLEVTDPAAFVTALTHGIGHGRSYSCGLLLPQLF